MGTTSSALQPRLLTVQQAAQYLGATIWCVRELHWSRKVRAIRMGKRLVFDRLDLDTYIDAQKEIA